MGWTINPLTGELMPASSSGGGTDANAFQIIQPDSGTSLTAGSTNATAIVTSSDATVSNTGSGSTLDLKVTKAPKPSTGSAHGAVTLDASANFQSVAPGSSGNYLRSNGTDFASSAIQAGDVPTLNQNTSGTAAGLSATLAIGSGGTGQTTKAPAFDALSPMTTLGDVTYGGTSGTGTRLAGNTTTTKKFLRQTGNGSVSAAPAWDTLVGSDLPNPSSSTLGGVQSAAAVSHQWINSISTSGVPALSQPAFSDVSGTADLTAQVTGVLPVANGGTNSSTSLNNNRVMQSSGGKIQEAAAITGSKALASDANGIPVASGTTSTELGYLSGIPSNTATLINELDPSLYLRLYDDFTSVISTNAGALAWTAASLTSSTSGAGGATNTNVDSGHPGIYYLDTVNTTTGGFGFRQYTNSIVLGGGVCTIEMLVNLGNLSTVGEEYVYHMGLIDTVTTGTDQANGVYMVYDRLTNGDFWCGSTANGGSRTRTASAVAVTAAAWHKLKIVINAAATSVAFTVDGSAVATITTNIPTSNKVGFGFLMYKTAGTTSRKIYHDYFKATIALTTPR